MTVHCDHCLERCSGCHPNQGCEPHESWCAQWMHGHCPACTEREQILGFLAAMRASVDDEARTTTSDTVRDRSWAVSDIIGYLIDGIQSGEHTTGGDT